MLDRQVGGSKSSFLQSNCSFFDHFSLSNESFLSLQFSIYYSISIYIKFKLQHLPTSLIKVLHLFIQLFFRKFVFQKKKIKKMVFFQKIYFFGNFFHKICFEEKIFFGKISKNFFEFFLKNLFNFFKNIFRKKCEIQICKINFIEKKYFSCKKKFLENKFAKFFFC